jgi:hypothetical protein
MTGNLSVIAGLVPAIHAFASQASKNVVPGEVPGMTLTI